MFKMSIRTQLLIVGFVVSIVAFAVTAFSKNNQHLEALDKGVEAAVGRSAGIEKEQLEQHDRLIRMDEKLDVLINSRRGTPPAGSQP